MSRRVGVLGGTFDPPHIGHLVIAADARDRLGLDVVLMVVANDPWQKRDQRRITDATDRFDMVAAAVEGEDAVVASAIEIERGGASYTVDTLRQLRAEDPGAELVLIIGADAAAGLRTWRDWESLAGLARLVVVDRPGETFDDDGLELEHLEAPRLEVSSSELRERVAHGLSLRHLVPDPVVAIIEQRGLYGEPR